MMMIQRPSQFLSSDSLIISQYCWDLISIALEVKSIFLSRWTFLCLLIQIIEGFGLGFVSLVSKKAPLATTGSLLSLCLCTHDLLFDNKAYKWMNSSRLSIHQKERPQKASFPKHICLPCMYIRLVQHEWFSTSFVGKDILDHKSPPK